MFLSSKKIRTFATYLIPFIMYSELAEGHPIRTYLHETELIQNLLEEIMQTDPEKDYQKFYNLFNHLSTV